MRNFWLLTWTTYGTWLPGDRRGFVGRVREGARVNGPRIEHDKFGTPYMAALSGLERASVEKMLGSPIFLNVEQAQVVAAQFCETAAYRGWLLKAGSVMRNHVHLVVGADEAIDPAKMLQSFKGYGSRALNQRWDQPASETWWTQSGSRRRLPTERAIAAGIRYVERQRGVLARCQTGTEH